MGMLDLNARFIGIIRSCEAMKDWLNHQCKGGCCQIHTFRARFFMFVWVFLHSEWVFGLVIYLFLIAGLFVLRHLLKSLEDGDVVSSERFLEISNFR